MRTRPAVVFTALTQAIAADAASRPGQEHSFRTQRPRGSAFTFGVQGDALFLSLDPYWHSTRVSEPIGGMGKGGGPGVAA